jgi:DNA adenine methylase
MLPKIKTYYEPFIGGGAVFFELARQKRFERAVIGDCNAELINAYKIVRDSIDSLVKELQTGDYEYAKPRYLRIRAMKPADLSNVERAARLIYLNRTCFNGLYRVNTKTGQFNVPFGRYKNPVICDEPNLRAISEALQNVDIQRTDFLSLVSDAKGGDVVYFDPPYIPTSKTSKFTSYNMLGFTEEDHRRLAECFNKLVESGVSVSLSNSFAPLALELYGQYEILELMGGRSVGGPASYRKPAKEIIVYGRKRTEATAPAESVATL